MTFCFDLALGESCARMPGQYSSPMCATGLRCNTASFTCVVDELAQQQSTLAGTPFVTAAGVDK